MPTTLDPMAALDAERPALNAMPADQVKEPPYPTAYLVAEANALYAVASRYKGSLVAVGIDPALIESLAQRAQALAGAQAARALVPDTKRSTEELATEEEACRIRSELFAAGRFATRGDAQAQSALDRIGEGTGFDDLVQDLKELSLFGGTHKDRYLAIKVDVESLTERALALAARFEQHLAERRTTTDAQRQATDLRNRAATQLYAAMAEIREAGAFAFRDDPNVLPLFRSAYRRRHRPTGRGGTGETGGGTGGEAAGGAPA